VNDWRKARLETLAVHAGHSVDPSTGAVSAPIHLSTTFERDTDGSYSRGFSYTRRSNPNREALECALAAFEGGMMAAAFASGSAATSAIFEALKPGDYVIMQTDAYYGTTQLVRDVFVRWGIEADFVDMTVPAEVDRAFARKPRLVWIETPSNPLLKIVDIEKIAERAHAAGAISVCDNTLGARAAAAVRLRRRCHSTLDYQIHWRPLRRFGRYRNREGRNRIVWQDSGYSGRRWRRPLTV